ALHCNNINSEWTSYSEPYHVAIVKEEAGGAEFDSCYGKWCSKILEHLKHCDLDVHQDTTPKALEYAKRMKPTSTN
ncbi:hypothetical protein GOP47_0013909, partial [Adiantum capillus-veneris]